MNERFVWYDDDIDDNDSGDDDDNGESDSEPQPPTVDETNDEQP